jgi:3-dehydroquinate synthase
MRTVPVNAERAYQVEIGVDWREALSDWLEGRNRVLVICSEKFPVETGMPTFQIPDGEAGKNAENLAALWRECGRLGLDRTSLIVGIGGGAVTDFAGFVAATWLRGIDWLAIPTTVAGMVDASLGGKTGINSDHGKNLIGSFHSPIGVLIDLAFTESLSERDLAAGLAEVVKCGFISDQQILQLLKNRSIKEISANKELLLELVHRAVSVKAEIVSEDFKESFLREILNYGHTLGHAIEKHSNYSLRHGEAVAIGMCFVAELAKEKLDLSGDTVRLHYEILESLGLPTKYRLDAWSELQRLMQQDKKNRAGTLRFVAIQEPGKCVRIEAPNIDELERAYARITQ